MGAIAQLLCRIIGQFCNSNAAGSVGLKISKRFQELLKTGYVVEVMEAAPPPVKENL